MQTIPVRMVGTPARTAAITVLLLLIGCGLGGGSFLYVRNGGSLFNRFIEARLVIPSYDNQLMDTDLTRLPALNPPDVNRGDDRMVPQPPPLPVQPTTVPSLPYPEDGARPPSFDALPDYPNLRPLPDVADMDRLLEKTDSGLLLPIIDTAQDRRAWRVYGRPFRLPRDTVPIAVVVRNLGLNRKATEAAINKLPPEVTLSFSFGSIYLEDDLRMARAAGHETLIELPLEPANYPVSDPGPDTLLTGLSFLENEKRLNATLGRGVGYVGVLAPFPSRYADSPQMDDLLGVLARRGLLFVGDTGKGPRRLPMELPMADISQEIDRRPFRAAIDTALANVTETVEKTGQRALITLTATPLALERLLEWTEEIERNPRAALAPVSAIVRFPPAGTGVPLPPDETVPSDDVVPAPAESSDNPELSEPSSELRSG